MVGLPRLQRAALERRSANLLCVSQGSGANDVAVRLATEPVALTRERRRNHRLYLPSSERDLAEAVAGARSNRSPTFTNVLSLTIARSIYPAIDAVRNRSFSGTAGRVRLARARA